MFGQQFWHSSKLLKSWDQRNMLWFIFKENFPFVKIINSCHPLKTSQTRNESLGTRIWPFIWSHLSYIFYKTIKYEKNSCQNKILKALLSLPKRFSMRRWIYIAGIKMVSQNIDISDLLKVALNIEIHLFHHCMKNYSLQVSAQVSFHKSIICSPLNGIDNWHGLDSHTFYSLRTLFNLISLTCWLSYEKIWAKLVTRKITKHRMY